MTVDNQLITGFVNGVGPLSVEANATDDHPQFVSERCIFIVGQCIHNNANFGCTTFHRSDSGNDR